MKKVLELKNISKTFPGVKALDGVSLDLYEGEVLCLAGENGAGKSTLIKIIAGIYQPDADGQIVLNGNPVVFSSPYESLQMGISTVHQEHKLLENMTVGENIYIGRFPMKKGFIDYGKLYGDAEEIVKKLELPINVKDSVGTLTSSQMQMVEIAKAYSRDAKIMIFDEPSSSITDSEVTVLLDLINKLKKEGKSFIYVSHKLKEMFVVGDRIAVLKDGKLVAMKPVGELDVDKTVGLMIGREIKKVFRPKDRAVGEEILRVEKLTNNRAKDVSFHIRAGEIVGFSGLVGAGRSEVAESIFGVRRMLGGKIFIRGKEVQIKTPSDAIRNGIAFVTEDRKKTGAIQAKGVGFNITLVSLRKYCRHGLIDSAAEKKVIDKSIGRLRIKTSSPVEEVQFLSGGNQQKVILAKWLLSEASLLICDEPTKGIDIGAKQEFYNILDDLARQGSAIMLISSEMSEIIGLSNRVYVMRNGELRAELQESELSEEKIAEYSMKD